MKVRIDIKSGRREAYVRTLRGLLAGDFNGGLIIDHDQYLAIDMLESLLIAEDVGIKLNRDQLTVKYQDRVIHVFTVGGGEIKLVNDLRGYRFDYVEFCAEVSVDTFNAINYRVINHP